MENEKTDLSLVELSAEFSALAGQLIDFGGELTPDREAYLESLQEAIIRKTDGYGIVIARLESESEFWAARVAECNTAKKAADNAAERLKARMKLVLGNTDGHALQGSVYRFYLAKAAPKLVIDDALLPAKFKVTEIVQKPDRQAITAAVKAGETPVGVTVEEVFALKSGRPK